MSNKQFRQITRILHLVTGILIAIFIYSPLRENATYSFLIQVIITPAIIISGIALWQQPRILKLLRLSVQKA